MLRSLRGYDAVNHGDGPGSQPACNTETSRRDVRQHDKTRQFESGKSRAAPPTTNQEDVMTEFP